MRRSDTLKLLLRYSRKIWSVVKYLLPLALAWALYQQILRLVNAKGLDYWLTNFDVQKQLPWLLLAVVLMPINWGLEVVKWQQLTLEGQPKKFSTLLKGILAGTALGAISPGRIGELGGRLLYARKGHRLHAAWSTFISHTAQWVVLFVCGVLGLQQIIPQLTNNQLLTNASPWGYMLIPLAIGVYFTQRFWLKVASKITAWPIKNGLPWHKLPHFNTSRLSVVLLLALMRYMVFSFQYACMLQFAGTETSILTLIPGIVSLFLLNAMAPLDTISGLLLRSHLALLIWNPIGLQPVVILIATIGLWVINLLLPSLMGTILILKTNPKNKKHVQAPLSTPEHSERSVPTEPVI